MDSRDSGKENWPDEWFEDQGIKLTDSACAILLHERQPMLGLFIRASELFTAPMAVNRYRDVLLVEDANLKGFFQSKYTSN